MVSVNKNIRYKQINNVSGLRMWSGMLERGLKIIKMPLT